MRSCLDSIEDGRWETDQQLAQMVTFFRQGESIHERQRALQRPVVRLEKLEF
jgi:hypothetical protein